MKHFWTKEEVEKFVKRNKVSTGGAITNYKPKIRCREDGDEWIEIYYGVWHYNGSVQRDVAKVLQKFMKKCNTKNGRWFTTNRGIVLVFDLHWCDPD